MGMQNCTDAEGGSNHAMEQFNRFRGQRSCKSAALYRSLECFIALSHFFFTSWLIYWARHVVLFKHFCEISHLFFFAGLGNVSTERGGYFEGWLWSFKIVRDNNANTHFRFFFC